jgi:hypothetical protein
MAGLMPCSGCMINHRTMIVLAAEVLDKWESLDAGVVQCFTYLLLALAPGAHPVQNALREHDRCGPSAIRNTYASCSAITTGSCGAV